MIGRMITLHVLLGLLLTPALVFAQDQNAAGRRGNFDPAQMRERFMNNIKEQLGAADDEWQVLQPKIEQVMAAQRTGRGGAFAGAMGRGRGGDRPAEQETAVQTASRELRTALENRNASAEELGRKLAALREAREKARLELAAAQKELKELVTVRQEAQLVSLGLLD
jgi:hypothetical protein